MKLGDGRVKLEKGVHQRSIMSETSAYVNETCAYLFNSHNFKLISEMYFNSIDQETFVAVHFAREVMYESEHVSFMTRDELNAILSYLCTE